MTTNVSANVSTDMSANMSAISMAVDLDMCTGCFACQNACKMVNNLEPGVKWLKVMPEYCKPEYVHGTLYMDRFPVPTTLMSCRVCPDRAHGEQDGPQPLCARSCMGQALFVGSPKDAAAWAENKRSVLYTQ